MSLRSNMKNKLLLLHEKLLLKKRGMIESVIDILKSVCNIEHTRHRSAINMFVNTYAALCAYSTLERKPSLSAKHPELTLKKLTIPFGMDTKR